MFGDSAAPGSFDGVALTVDRSCVGRGCARYVAAALRPFWHTVAAALRGRDGRIWTGIHLGATVGRLAICAEAVALGRAVMDGDGTIECVVAVRHPKPEESVREIAVVSPCGACRRT